MGRTETAHPVRAGLRGEIEPRSDEANIERNGTPPCHPEFDPQTRAGTRDLDVVVPQPTRQGTLQCTMPVDTALIDTEQERALRCLS